MPTRCAPGIKLLDLTRIFPFIPAAPARAVVRFEFRSIKRLIGLFQPILFCVPCLEPSQGVAEPFTQFQPDFSHDSSHPRPPFPHRSWIPGKELKQGPCPEERGPGFPHPPQTSLKPPPVPPPTGPRRPTGAHQSN